jgi:hypothetical protein
MSFTNMLRSDKPESTSRFIAFYLSINIPPWIWYSLITNKTTALLTCLAPILSFIVLLLGIKMYNERQPGGTPDAVPTGSSAASGAMANSQP